ncbi:MAG TPA: hypothetical protein VFJ65_01935 [Solirubrobacterales bacterium]|nr:hypothetical protein [Solirubrobacterales bacterium]
MTEPDPPAIFGTEPTSFKLYGPPSFCFTFTVVTIADGVGTVM